MPTTRKQNWILGAAGAVAAVLTAVYLIIDLPEKVDPLIFTAVEAQAAHDLMLADNQKTQNVQAAFNAYTLRQLLLQEIKLLELQIAQEEDEAEREELLDELKHKKEFVRELEDEERRQMHGGES